jgi:nucleotide-binding universal stress UspA family protein
MSEMPRKSQFIVAYDFSPSAEEALIRAIDAASRAPQHVLHVLAAIDPNHGLAVLPSTDVTYAYAERIQALVTERMTASLAGRVGLAVQFFVHARIGSPAQEILQLAEELGADLIYIGSHGRRGLERALLGSVSERVVREARCPVLVARHKEYRDVDLRVALTADRPHKRYVRPHRYSYSDNRVITRPDDWPL